MTVTELVEELAELEHRGLGGLLVRIDANAGHMARVECATPGYDGIGRVCIVLNDTALYPNGVRVERVENKPAAKLAAEEP